MISSSGCCSYMVLQDSKRKVAVRRAFEQNDENVIRAIRIGEDGAGIGMDLIGNWEAFKENKLGQFLAAIFDVLCSWGLIEIGQAIESHNNADNNSNISTNSYYNPSHDYNSLPSPNINIINTGHGNNYYINTGDNNTDALSDNTTD